MDHNRMLWGTEERYVVDGMERIKVKPKRSAYNMKKKTEIAKAIRVEDAIRELKKKKFLSEKEKEELYDQVAYNRRRKCGEDRSFSILQDQED